ncbi:GNAT family N-acetyltransferase [Fructobacillus sp. M2-14]|uniref:GNAT family N-acetyltransferase n=1 Tax=Fructobacillus broussonetiae TaxID=2713173 RepID=A0ABS5R1N6_9LACO|nr:GNAT family N-acetyltransferase [Fructobacillus broussonetiae]MBS9338551.1 GNAT family N-acetyltransferase [Fructobacillus broussonetiae]
MKLRPATQSDADQIYMIAQTAFQRDLLPKELLDHHLSADRVHYLINEQQTAFLSYTKFFDEAELDLIAVQPGMQGQGLGQAVLEEWLSELGPCRILLEVAENNIRARNLYLKFGFSAYHERKNYYPDGQTAILMEKKQ